MDQETKNKIEKIEEKQVSKQCILIDFISEIYVCFVLLFEFILVLHL